MSNNRDVVLQNLFEEAHQTLDDNNFTPQVIRRTRGLLIRLGVAVFGVLFLLLAVMAVLGITPLEVGKAISGVMSTPLFDLGEGWPSWIFAPINNMAGVLVLCAKSMRILYKKVLRAT